MKQLVKDFVKNIAKNGNINMALFLEGLPGTAKSARILQAVNDLKEEGMDIEFIHLSGLANNDDDFSGMAYPNDKGQMEYLKPYWFDGDTSRFRLIFIDEVGGMSIRKQQTLLKLITEGVLPDGTPIGKFAIIMAGNSVEDAGGDAFSNAFRMRLIRIKVEPDMEEFINWCGIKGYGDVVGFLKKNPSAYGFRDEEEGIILTNRLWENAQRFKDNQELLIGILGVKIATEFAMYMSDKSLLSYEDWKNRRKEYLKDKETEKIALLYYAIPLDEKVEFFNDLKEVCKELWSGLLREFILKVVPTLPPNKYNELMSKLAFDIKDIRKTLKTAKIQ